MNEIFLLISTLLQHPSRFRLNDGSDSFLLCHTFNDLLSPAPQSVFNVTTERLIAISGVKQPTAKQAKRYIQVRRTNRAELMSVELSQDIGCRNLIRLRLAAMNQGQRYGQNRSSILPCTRFFYRGMDCSLSRFVEYKFFRRRFIGFCRCECLLDVHHNLPNP